MHYILNESDNPAEPGTLEVYANLQTLMLDVEPVDVGRRSYYVYDEEGYRVDLSLDDDTGKVISKGRTGRQDREALEAMLRQEVELLRRIHPECVGKPGDELAQMGGPEPAEYILRVYRNFETRWRRSRRLNRMGRMLVWYLKHRRRHGRRNHDKGETASK